MKTRIVGLLLAILLPVQAGAAFVSGHGVSAGTSTINCPSSCSGGTYDSDGGQGFTTASASTLTTIGSSSAFSRYTGSTSTPELKARAQGFSSSARASASAFALQVYEYTGAVSRTYELNYSIHGITTLSSLDAQVISRIALLNGDANPADYYPDWATYVFEFRAGDIADQAQEFIFNGEDTLIGTLSITVNPGDRFTLAAELVASAKGVSSANAFNTVSMSFADGSDLVASGITAVPEPSTWLLFGAGLAGLMFGRRRLRQ